MTLFRAQSMRRLEPGKRAGHFRNPSLDRDRKPRDLSVPTHIICDSWFEARFGIRFRSLSLIGTGDINIARGYLSPDKALIEFSPTMDYQLCFSRNCKDLFGTLQFRLLDEADRNNKKTIADILDSLDYECYKNENLVSASESGCEVMVFAESFRYRVLS